MLLRTDPIYFIYQTADFGEYVNRANRIAAGGPFGEWFLDLFPATLSVPSLIFGSIHTVDAMPLLGLLVVLSRRHFVWEFPLGSLVLFRWAGNEG